jgi:sugar lactone lactonase YvrE
MLARWMAAAVGFLIAQGAPTPPPWTRPTEPPPAAAFATFRAQDAGIGRPSAVASDARGRVFLAAPELSRVFMVDAAGEMRVAAGGGKRPLGPVPLNPQAIPNGDAGAAPGSLLSAPIALAVDGRGNVYIADDADRMIRRIDGGTGVITTALRSPMSVPPHWLPLEAGPPPTPPPDSARRADVEGPVRPWGLAADAAGNLYVADRATHAVFRVPAAPSEPIERIAGSGVPGYVGDGGPAGQARLSSPEGIALDAAANLFIADRANHCVRRVDARTGTITTIIGDGFAGDSGDGGRASAAQLREPVAVAVDAGGDVFIADLGNQRVRRVAKTTGLVSTVAGLEHVACSAMAVAADGSLLVTDTGRGVVLRRSRKGLIATVAGNGGIGYVADGGPATSAFLSSPAGLARDATGNLYVADRMAHRVRRIDAQSGVISTVVGNGRPGFSGDGGPAVEAILDQPRGVAFDREGRLLIADSRNHRIRRVAADGTITTIAGNGAVGLAEDGAPALQTPIGDPTAIAVDADGNLIVAEAGFIHRIDAAGKLRTIVGRLRAAPLSDGAPATSGYIRDISAVAIGSRGDILFADEASPRVWSVDVGTGIASVVAGRGLGPPEGPSDEARGVSFGAVEAITVDAAGNLYIGELTRVRRIDAATRKVVTILDGSGGIRPFPSSLLLAEPDTLYVADSVGYVRRLGPGGRMDVIAGGGIGF